MQCLGIKASGDKCTTLCLEGERCKIHQRSLVFHGPNTSRRRELKFIHDKNIGIIFSTRNIADRQTYDANIRLERIRYQTALHDLETLIAQETAALGRNADQEAIEARNRRIRELRRRWDERHQARMQMRDNRIAQGIQAQGQVDQQIHEQNLGALAQDRQNIHTTIVVQKIKSMVEIITQIYVPPEYETETLKTPGEIILECGLTKKAAWQMMAKYCEEVDIYDLGVGIYPKILNCVWQYIKQSEHREDLKKILKSEMQDNIGMCQQGNLSRLCNILSGYLDGLNAHVQSPKEILGDRLAELLRREPEDMYQEARAILQEMNFPEEEWEDWLTPFMDV
jgi:hypothetical protein